MSFRTIAAAFERRDQATAAVSALRADGFTADDINLLARTPETDGNAWSGERPSLWHRAVGQEVLHNDTSIYRDLLARGGAVVAVRVPANEVEHATGILDRHHPVKVGNHALPVGVGGVGANLRDLIPRTPGS
jgi:hypothetical protein